MRELAPGVVRVVLFERTGNRRVEPSQGDKYRVANASIRFSLPGISLNSTCQPLISPRSSRGAAAELHKGSRGNKCASRSSRQSKSISIEGIASKSLARFYPWFSTRNRSMVNRANVAFAPGRGPLE